MMWIYCRALTVCLGYEEEFTRLVVKPAGVPSSPSQYLYQIMKDFLSDLHSFIPLTFLHHPRERMSNRGRIVSA